MYKLNKETSSSGNCTPTSSDCIIWQGPCLDCININTGDTVSQVIALLANQICDIQQLTGLSDLDLKCLFDSSLGNPEPEKTIANIFNLLITKTCTIETILEGINPEGYVLPNINIASCFQVTDLNGDLITSQRLDDYTKAIGIKVCSILSTVNQHTSTLTNHETRITILENAPDPDFIIPQVTPVCVISGNIPRDIDEVVEALEVQFCQLRSVTGLPTDLSTAVGKQCVNLNSALALSQSGTMAGITGWKTTPSTVADTLNNMWLTICDMRSAVNAVKSCCDADCSDITVDFIVSIIDNGGKANIYLSGYSNIPAGFEDCNPSGSVMTITDGLGGSYNLNINIATASASNTPIVVDFSSTPLSPGSTYSFSLASCLTDGSLQCNKTVIKTASGSASVCSIPSDVSATIS